jgi:energy-coupling factor transporter transmembrane protein EcfT
MNPRLKLILLISFIVFAFTVNIFGLMKIYPILVTSPLLFLSLLLLILYFNNRKRFKGFKP